MRFASTSPWHLRCVNKIMSRYFRCIKHLYLSNSLILIVYFGFHTTLMVLLNNVTAFAPDEENYISVFKNLYRSDFTLYGYLGWPDGSINAIRVIYFPAKILETIGFSDFFAVRFLSLFYTLISLYLLLRSTNKIRILGKPARLWILSAYCIPSFFL